MGFCENGLSILDRVLKCRGPLGLFPFVLCLPGVPERVLEESVRDARRLGFLPGLWFLGSLQLGPNESLDDFVADTVLLGAGLDVSHFCRGAFANRPTVVATDALEDS